MSITPPECTYFRYPTCNAHVPYYHRWFVPLYNICPLYLINDTIFEKELLTTKFVFRFPLLLLSEIFLAAKRKERDKIKYVYGSSCQVPLFWSDFNKTWIFFDIFRKVFKYKISLKSVEWEPSCCMRTDGHDEADSRFSQFSECAWSPNCFTVFRRKCASSTILGHSHHEKVLPSLLSTGYCGPSSSIKRPEREAYHYLHYWRSEDYVKLHH